jgi:hypothetical protein
MHEWRLETEETQGHTGPKRSFASISRKWGLIAGICAFSLSFLFHDEVKGAAASYSAAMIAVAVRYFWDLRKRIWFWITVIFIVLLHVPVILFIRWPFNQHYNYVQMLPPALLDFAIMYGIIRLVERAVENNS